MDLRRVLKSRRRRRSFTVHHTYAGFYVFLEDDDLPRENHISPSRLRAMRSSRISVVVLSASYGSSGSCLLELEKIIVLCRSFTVWIPQRYFIREVRLEKRFAVLPQRNSAEEDEKLHWRAALSEARSVEGIVVTNFGPKP